MTFFYLYFQSLHIKQHLINSVEASFLRTLTNSDINLGINYNKKKYLIKTKICRKISVLREFYTSETYFYQNLLKGGGFKFKK